MTDDRGRGIRVECAPGSPIEFSALPFTPFEVEDAPHAFELASTGRTVLRPALMRRGAGVLTGGPGARGAAPGRLLRTFPSAALLHPPLRFFFSYSGG